MHDRSMLLELFLEIQEGIRRIERRFSGAEEIYRLCINEIEPFKIAIEQLRNDSF